MARPRKEVPAHTMEEMVKRGMSGRRMAGALDVSPRTAARRKKEFKATGRPAPAAVAPLPARPEDVPADAPLALLDEWLETARACAEQAKMDGDLSQVAAMGRLAVSISEAKRKATPVPVQDPNEHPDMVALGAQVAERLHVLIDQVTG